MRYYLVRIPGIAAPYTTSAENEQEAVKDALLFHGLRSAPPGTTVTWRVGRTH